MSYAIPGYEPDMTNEQPSTEVFLRSELGWPEVRKELGRILLGYLLIVSGTLTAIALIVFAIWQGDLLHGFKKAGGWHIVSLMAGMVLLGIINLVGYFLFILPGHWKCLLNTPERKGARWIMFACLTCIVMGPALNFVGGSAMGNDSYQRIEKSMKKGTKLELDKSAVIFQASCVVIELGSVVLFVLYLRAIALCFDDHVRARIMEAYLAYLLLLAGGAGFLLFTQPKLLLHPAVLLGLLGGGVFAFLWYLALFPIIRSGITQGLEALDLKKATANNAAAGYPGMMSTGYGV